MLGQRASVCLILEWTNVIEAAGEHHSAAYAPGGIFTVAVPERVHLAGAGEKEEGHTVIVHGAYVHGLVRVDGEAHPLV